MPSYEYQCTSCNTQFEQHLSIAEREAPLKNPCPECQTDGTVEQFLSSAPGIGDPVRLGIKKPPADFQKYVLGRIQSAVPGANRVQHKFQIPSER